jgi:hypothetical protein
VNLTLLEPLKYGLDQTGERLGVDRELTVQNAAGDGDREADQVRFGFAAQLGAARDYIAEHLPQSLELGFEVLLELATSGLLSLAAAGGERVLEALVGGGAGQIQFGFERRDRGPHIGRIDRLRFGTGRSGRRAFVRHLGRPPFDRGKGLSNAALYDFGQHAGS